MGGKRRWFQISLTTSVVVMFVAGVLVWANIGIPREPYLSDGQLEYYGWPFEVYGKYWNWNGPAPYAAYWVWDMGGALKNIFVDLAILAILGLLCEALIRRRERKQQEPKG